MVFQLGPWGKVLVLAIGAGVVMITLIIVVCIVGPGCWGYEWVHRAEEDRRRRRQAKRYKNHTAEDTLKLSDYNYPWKRNPLPSHASYDIVNSTGSLIGRMAHHRDSTYSSMSEATDNRSILSMKSVTTEGSCSTDCSANSGPPVLTMSLKYVTNDENGTGRLVIYIKDVKSLPPREYAGGLEPYLVVQVARTTWPLHRRAGPPLHQLRTRTLRHSFSPFFDQTFVLDVKRSELKEWCLKVTAYDQDKYSSATELCDVSLALRDVKNLTTAGEALTVSCNLTKTNREVGDLLFGVSYLPTAQRLSVSVIKASNLKYLEIVDFIAAFNPYVRVIQLNGSTGRSIKRKKTAFKHGTECPEFNETLTFDLSPNQLETTTFLVLLCSRTLCEGSDGQMSKKSKDRCLGKVALGSHVAGKQQRDHWLSVMQNPRRVVSAWYALSFSAEYHPGGAAQNTLRIFQWVVNCPLYSVFLGGIGNDDEGKLLEKLVKNAGVETRYKYHNDYPTGSCLALINGENRSLVVHLGAANIYEPSDLLQHMQILEQVNIIYIESFFISHSYEAGLTLLKLCQDRKIALVFNIGAVYMCSDFANEVSHFAKYANILFGNKEEFKALGKVMNLECESTKDIALALHNMSNQGQFLESCELRQYLDKMGKIIVVTDGKDSVLCVYGSACSEPSVIKFNLPVVRQELIKDTTGAGDSFVAGFLAGVFVKHNIKTCIAWGCWAAQQVIQLIGCQVPPYPSDEIHKIRY